MSSRKLDNEENLKIAASLLGTGTRQVMFKSPLPLSSDLKYNAIAGKNVPGVGYLFVTYRRAFRDDEAIIEEILVEKDKSYRYVGDSAGTWGHDFYIKRRKTFVFYSKIRNEVVSAENFGLIQLKIQKRLCDFIAQYSLPIS